MIEQSLDGSFWTNRWSQGQTGWDIGYPSPALKKYVEENVDKDAKILVPGAGNGYEASWMIENGWTNVHVLDIAHIPLDNIKQRSPAFPVTQLIHSDFFLHEGSYEVILEQTFFCALPPHLRPDYALKMSELLQPGGKLAGLMFSFPLTDQGPPFGGSKPEYEALFQPYFDILTMETTSDSIKPRMGNEFWVEMARKA